MLEKHRIPKIKENVKKRKARYEEIILGLEAGKGWKDLGFKDAREFYYYMKFDAERTGRPDRYLKRQYLNNHWLNKVSFQNKGSKLKCPFKRPS